MPSTVVSLISKVARVVSGFPSPLLHRAIIVSVSLAFLPGCYTLKQAYYQGNLLSTRKPIELLLWQKDTPEKLKTSLREVEVIRDYARKQGLSVGGAYGTYIESENSAVSYIVQASPPLELTRKEWWFPIIGSVPYLGFYHESNREREAKSLRAEGYDVAEGFAGAFSSLGWYDDPVYSPMLRRPHHALAHLFFHELTHRTFWIPGEVKLNEHMAEFIAIRITRQYLRDRKMTEALQEYNGRLRDKEIYAAWVGQLKDDLKALYASKGSHSKKLTAKAALFKKYLGEKFPKFETNRYAYLRKKEWNNAVVMAASLYLPEIEPFERAYSCGSYENAGAFLRALEERFDQLDKAPLKVLESFCSKSKLGATKGS